LAKFDRFSDSLFENIFLKTSRSNHPIPFTITPDLATPTSSVGLISVLGKLLNPEY
jgi:hypothetical protein